MKIGRYEILDKLGEGAMGTVYRARDPLIERTVAIKTIPLVLPEEEKRLFEDRFLREAKSAGKLSHPNIVTIYDVGETDDVAYIAMEYLEGPSLRELLRKHGRLPPQLAVETALQMAEAIAFAHDHGIVHRDVKPPNVIVLSNRGTVKLTDFGIAHLMSSNETRAGMLMGSPRYMSPEQVQGQPIDGRSDIFSLGVVLHEMLTGRPVFGGEELHGILFRIVNEPVPPVSSLRPGLPAELDTIVSRCLAKRPEERYAYAGELAEALRSLLLESQAALNPPDTPSPIPRSLKYLAFGTPFLVLLAIAIGLIVISFFLGKNRPPAQPMNEPVLDLRMSGTPTRESAGLPASQQTKQAQEKAAQTKPAQQKTPQRQDFYLIELDKKLAQMKVQRSELLSQYTELHPDIVMLDRQIDKLQDEKRRYLKQQRRQNN